MASSKKTAAAKPTVKFKDLKSKNNPKGGLSFTYGFKTVSKSVQTDSASPNLDKLS
jgi:hypothetical protein